MKTKVITFGKLFGKVLLAGLLLSSLLNAQVTATGLSIQQGATFYAGNGLYINNNGGDSLIVNGTLVVEDSLVVSNPALSKIEGKLVLSGNDTLLVKAGGLRVDTLQISAGDDKACLSQNIAVNHQLRFSSGNLYLNGHKLALGPNAAITFDGGHTTTVPIVANNRSEVVLEDFTGNLNIPFGYGNQYRNAITLNNTGAADTFSVSVMPNVLDNGLSGNAITQDVVQVSWMIDDAANAPYDLSLILHWHTAQEGNGFNSTKAGVAYFENNDWDLNGGHLTHIDNDAIQTKSLTNIENLVLTVADASSSLMDAFNLAINVFLQGPYNSSNGTMSASLNGLLPDSASNPQAYGAPPYSYTGLENLGGTGPPDAFVVDWVLVELRQAPSATQATSATTLLTMAGLLLDNGEVIAAYGSGDLNTGEINITDNLYLVVRHRNHADVMSAVPLTRINGTYSYDFTTAVNKAYGSGLIQLASGVWGMHAGDSDGNNDINSNDRNTYWRVDNGTTGTYSRSDCNMDGDVNAVDRNAYWRTNNGLVISLP